MKNLVNILNATGDAVDKAHAEGVHVNGERYVVTKIEDRSAYCRQVRLHHIHKQIDTYLPTYLPTYL